MYVRTPCRRNEEGEEKDNVQGMRIGEGVLSTLQINAISIRENERWANCKGKWPSLRAVLRVSVSPRQNSSPVRGLTSSLPAVVRRNLTNPWRQSAATSRASKVTSRTWATSIVSTRTSQRRAQLMCSSLMSDSAGLFPWGVSPGVLRQDLRHQRQRTAVHSPEGAAAAERWRVHHSDRLSRIRQGHAQFRGLRRD